MCKRLQELFTEWRNVTKLLTQPNFSEDTQEIIAEWIRENFVTTGLGLLLVEMSNEKASVFFTIRRASENGDWITTFINHELSEVNATTRPHFHWVQANHAFYLVFLIATAAFEQANMNGFGERWKLLRETHTNFLLETEVSADVKKDAAEILVEITGHLPDGHPVFVVLRELTK